MTKISSVLAALWLSLFTCVYLATPAQAAPTSAYTNAERIDNYESHIVIGKDSNITVTETITVTTPNNLTIKRGIYRDYPLNYVTGMFRTNVHINVLEVSRDGKDEDYHTEDLSNGIRYYFGNADVFLKPGTYTYTFKYTVDRMLGFFPDHDELYYNITGNGWSYPILKAKAEIELPAGIAADKLTVDFYTGAQGSKDQSATKKITTVGDHQMVTVSTIDTLSPAEGLTVAVGWPKGVVTPPSTLQNAIWIVIDNFPIFLGILVLPCIIMYCFAIWFLKGRDPRPGTIIPLFSPPDNISPGVMRYIDKMHFDDKAITAAVIDLAVKKKLTISEEKTGIFNATQYSLIKRSENYEGLPDEELAYFDKIFSETDGIGTAIKLTQSEYLTFQIAKGSFQKSIESQYKGSHVKGNRFLLTPAYIVAIIYYVILFAFYANTAQSDADGFLILALVWNGIIAIVLIPIFKAVFSNTNNTGTAVIGKLVFGCFTLPFIIFGGIAIVLAVQSNPISLVLMAAVLGSILSLVFATMFMPNRTNVGRKVEDKILGFKMFLNTTERYRIAELIPKLPLDLGDKKQNTSEDVVRLKLFETYLPYAVALDIEKKWSEEFAEVLARNQAAGDQYGSWYSGSHMFSSAAFASSLSSGLGGAVASSSVAPGSSSGGGGGGSSGGGGGGGGGGGW